AATTDAYTYISIFVDVLDSGLPRAAYLAIGDRSRRTGSTYASHSSPDPPCPWALFEVWSGFAGGFVPADVRENSRISAFAALTSAATYSASFATRSTDRIDVFLIINTTTTGKLSRLEVLEGLTAHTFMFLCTFRTHTKHQPTLKTQARIRLACDAAGAIASLLYFVSYAHRHLHNGNEDQVRKPIQPKFST
ncbi:hypothetical protein FS837_004002, partial [Tulasnella sp. UAMH 9824]